MSISSWKRFGLLLKPDQQEIKNLYLFAVFSGLMYLAVPLGIQAITNLIQIGQINASWVLLVGIVIGSVAFSGLLQIQQLKITELIQQKIFARAAFELTYRIPRIKEEALKGKQAPELMNRFFDTVSVQKGVSKILIDFSTAIVQILFGMIVLAFYHPFYIAFSLLLIFSVAVFIRFSFKKGLKSSLAESTYKYRTAHWLEEVARNKRSFKLLGNPDIITKKTNDEVEAYVTARNHHFKILLSQYRMMILFKVLLIAGLLVIGGMLVMEQQMNIGQFVAAEIIILLIMNSVEKIILSAETVYDVLTSLEKIGQITDMNLEPDQGYSIDREPDEFRLDLIDFLPSEYITAPLNISIEQSQTLVLNTSNEFVTQQMIRIFSGYDTGRSGSLFVNDNAFKNLNVEDYRRNVGFVLGEDTLFDASLYDNITLGDTGIKSNEIQRLLKILNLIELIRELPEGFDTRILLGENKLPEHVRSKIVLARNIFQNPKLLVLENPSVYLSPEILIEVLAFLKEINPSAAVIIIEEKSSYEIAGSDSMILTGQVLTVKR